jgi:hypothetical protein
MNTYKTRELSAFEQLQLPQFTYSWGDPVHTHSWGDSASSSNSNKRKNEQEEENENKKRMKKITEAWETHVYPNVTPRDIVDPQLITELYDWANFQESVLTHCREHPTFTCSPPQQFKRFYW